MKLAQGLWFLRRVFKERHLDKRGLSERKAKEL